jgi:hypothetical protein
VARKKTIAEMPVGSVGWTESRVLREDPDGKDALHARLGVSHVRTPICTVRIEHRRDGYYIDYAAARPCGPARWNAKLIPVAGGLMAPARIRATYTALLAAAGFHLRPEDPGFHALVCEAGTAENVTPAEAAPHDPYRRPVPAVGRLPCDQRARGACEGRPRAPCYLTVVGTLLSICVERGGTGYLRLHRSLQRRDTEWGNRLQELLVEARDRAGTQRQ